MNEIEQVRAERRKLTHAHKVFRKKLSRATLESAAPPTAPQAPAVGGQAEAILMSQAEEFLEVADQSAHAIDPAERFAAMHLYLIRSMLRGIANGAPVSETMGLRELNELMFEMADGNYDDPRLPKPSGKGKGAATVRVYAALMGLMRLSETAAGGTVADNATKVVGALDKHLSTRGYSVEEWVEAHNKSKGAGSGNRAVARLMRWQEDGKCPCSDGASYEECAAEFIGHALHLQRQGANVTEAFDSLILFTATLILKTAKVSKL